MSLLQHLVLFLSIKYNFMNNSGDVIKKFYDAVISRDISTARTYLKDDLIFVGLFETYKNANEYIAALTGLLQITVRLDVKVIISERENVAVFFELETKDPAAATTLVAEWHQVTDGKIVHVRSAFDGRPFEGMFTKK